MEAWKSSNHIKMQFPYGINVDDKSAQIVSTNFTVVAQHYLIVFLPNRVIHTEKLEFSSSHLGLLNSNAHKNVTFSKPNQKEVKNKSKR